MFVATYRSVIRFEPKRASERQHWGGAFNIRFLLIAGAGLDDALPFELFSANTHRTFCAQTDISLW
jgi:hypothetical protein